MHNTIVSPVSCYVGVKIFLMYALYFCQPFLMLCRCEDLSDVCTILLSVLYRVCSAFWCSTILLLCRCDLSDVCTILLSALTHVMQVWRSFWCMHYTFVSPLMLCRCEDLSDVCTILLSALSHVMQVWRSFWCMHYTFVSPVSDVCTIVVKTSPLMYAL